MIKRHLEGICFDPAIRRQMRFITGPRQSGKTTGPGIPWRGVISSFD